MSSLQKFTQRTATALGRRSLRRRRTGPAQCSRVSSSLAPRRSASEHLHLQPAQQAFDLASLLTLIPRSSSPDDEADINSSSSNNNNPVAAPTPSTAVSSADLPVFQRECSVLDVVSDARVLKAVARVKLFGLPSQVNGTLPAGYHSGQNIAAEEDLAFCSKSLDEVSRSFAAVIRQLPQSLAVPTCVFYLVLRALDTVEDEMDFGKFSAASKKALRGSAAATATVASDPLLFKTSCLLNFDSLLAGPTSSNWTTLEALNSHDVGAGNDQILLQSFDKVVRVLQDHCSPEQQEIISDITRQMATGMAEYVQRDLGADGTKSRADYNKYCHIVAGLVGEGLSRLWATAPDSGLPAASLEAVNAGTGLGSLSSDMGLFLQKANIIRDYAEDQVDGRAFWPEDVWSHFSPTGRLGAFLAVSEQPTAEAHEGGLACLNSMVNDALSLAPSCFQYLEHLAPGDARILRFCAIPQVMALCTLAECYSNPSVFQGIVKTPRTQSARICCEVGDMEGVLGWYSEVCDDLEQKAAAWEASASFDPSRDAPVAAETRARVDSLRRSISQFAGADDQKQQSHDESSWDDDDDIPENWPCGPHCMAPTDDQYLEHLLVATR